MLKRTFHCVLTCLVCVSLSAPAFSWGDQGHQTVARIAARNLSPAAINRIAAMIRGVPPAKDDLHLLAMIGASGTPTVAQIERVLVTIATWPDHIPTGKQETEPWHFVDIGLFETPASLSQRCPGGACVAQKITDMERNIKTNVSITRVGANKQPPVFTPDLELRFLVHFVGDIHQPLHAATDADAGANCIKSSNISSEMHAVWDTGLVTLAAAGTSDFAGDLIQRFNAQKAQFQAQLDPVLIVGESFGLAKTAVYAKATPAIPTINQFVNVIPSKCAIQAPAAINAVTINAQQSFQNPATLDVIRQQLYKGGVRLAAILNRL